MEVDDFNVEDLEEELQTLLNKRKDVEQEHDIKIQRKRAQTAKKKAKKLKDEALKAFDEEHADKKQRLEQKIEEAKKKAGPVVGEGSASEEGVDTSAQTIAKTGPFGVAEHDHVRERIRTCGHGH